MARIRGVSYRILDESNRDWEAVVRTALTEVPFDMGDVQQVEWGMHPTNNQLVYVVSFNGGIEVDVFGSKSGMTFATEGSPS